MSPARRLACCLACTLAAWPAATPAAAAQPEAVSAAMSSVESALGAAEESLRFQEVQQAESHYRTALHEAWLVRGSLEVAEGSLEAARTAFESALASSVRTRKATSSLALVLVDLGDGEAAVALLRQLLAAHPDDVAGRRLLARALVAAGRDEEAVQELVDARALAPEDPELAYVLATGYLRIGDVAQARPLFDEVVAARPAAETHVLVGRTYRDFQHYEPARDHLRLALEMDPQVKRAHFYLGTVDLRADEHAGLDAAVEHFQAELQGQPDDPLAGFHLGLALAEQRRFREALAPLEIAARAEPSRVEALRQLGRCHLGLGETAEAARSLQRALDAAVASGHGENLSNLHYQLGQALRRSGDETAATPHFAAAEQLATEAVDESRQRLSRYLDDAVAMDADGAERDAFASPIGSPLVALDAASRRELRARLDTALVRAYLNLGVLHTRAGRFLRAQRHFRSAAAIDPEFPQLQRNLGVALFNAEQYRQALAPLDLALQQHPADPLLRRMLALAHLEDGDAARTVELLADDDGRHHDPSLQFAYIAALVRSGHGDQARPLIDSLLAARDDWPEMHVLLGKAHAADGDYAAAVGRFRRALELDPQVAEAHVALAEVYLRRGELAAAESELRRELELRPRQRQGRMLLATALDMAGRPEDATEVLESLLADEPEVADGRYLLGKILYAAGDSERAAEQLEAAAELAPGDANVRYLLAQAYRRLERPELAEQQLETYRRLKGRDQGPGGEDSP